MRVTSQDAPDKGKRVVLDASALRRLHRYAMREHYDTPRDARADGYADALDGLFRAVGVGADE